MEVAIFCLAIGVQLVGLSSVVATRLGTCAATQRSCQWFFFTSLAVVALVTVWSVLIGTNYWLSCGTTLSFMAIGATIDLRQDPDRQAALGRG